MADVTASEQQWLSALALMVVALFVSAGLPIAPRWQRRLRIAALGVFSVAAIAAIILTAIWLAGGSS